MQAAGNISGSYFIGNGAGLTSITGANVTGTVANATYATSAGTVTTAAQPNITSVGTLTSITSTGNVTGDYFIGNGSQLTGIAGTYGNANVATFLANFGSNIISATGNITGGNLTTIGTLASGNLIVGQQYINANIATQINTIGNNNGTLSTATNFGNAQIVIGSGYFGNLALNQLNGQAPKGGKFVVWDSATLSDGGNVGIRYAATGAVSQVMLGGNLNNNNTLFRAQAAVLSLGGSANNYTLSQSVGQGISGVAGTGGTLFIGQPNTQVALGNVTVGGGVGLFGQEITYPGSNMGNAAGVLAQIQNNGNTTTGIGLAIELKGTSATPVTNAFGVYMPNVTGNYGVINSYTMRGSANYYFLYNDDDVAQNKLGSLRAYHTFQAGGNTTGTWNIDKTNGQVQSVSATGNITIGSYTNFVTIASHGGGAFDNQTDTVTLIIEQGATPYTITMPTGNSAIRYSNGNSTVPATANSTTTISIQAYRTAANTAAYITTISPAAT